MWAKFSKHVVILSLLIFFVFTGCSNSGSNSGSGCTKDTDCRYGRVCENGICVEYEGGDGIIPDGDSASVNGDLDTIEDADRLDTATDGDVVNAEADRDEADRDEMDADSLDGNSDRENDSIEEDQGCDLHASVACNNGDVFWKDCNGNWSGRKEDCGDCGCVSDACEYEQLSSLQCYNGDVYWFDCMSEPVMRSEACGNVNCIDGECTNYPSLICADRICFDPSTQLEWEQVPLQCSGSEMVFYNHEQARRYCRNLSLGGEGWRLPNITELRSLVRGCPYMEVSGECNVYDECETCGMDSENVCLDDSDECYTTFCDLPCEDYGEENWIGPFFSDQIHSSYNAFWSSSRVTNDTSMIWVLWAQNNNYPPIQQRDDDPNYGICPFCVRGPVRIPRK